MWFQEDSASGIKLFVGGQEDWTAAQAVASACRGFRPDEEDEQCDEVSLSCYNCRYRRWTVESFSCLAG